MEISNAVVRQNLSSTIEDPKLRKLETAIVVPGGKNPTSKGLYLLSNLDQTFPYPIEILFAFKGNCSNVNVGEVLKQSLGKVLEQYYPLTGGVEVSWDGKMMVDLDGGERGVPFVEAFSDEEMAAAVGEDITIINEKLAKFVCSDYNPDYETILDVPPLTVQVTTFKCGGIILGMGFNHVLIDGRGFADFMESWSHVARGMPLSICPNLDRSFFLASQCPKVHISHPEYSKSKRPLCPLLNNPNQKHKIIVNKSFCFTPGKLSQLQGSALQGPAISPAVTRFELISALVWICWTKATKVSPEKTAQIITAVDGRQKFEPPMPTGYFGNGIVWSCARAEAQQLTSRPLAYAVGIVHDAIKAVTEEYVRSAIDFHEVMRKPLEQENTLWITKWSRLPFYEIDFGWGPAAQVAPASLVDNLAVSLLQGKDSENLMVSLSLSAEAMEIFQELMESHTM